ncbi:MAG: ATP-dependent helicase [Planctomycetota bacterium]|jgi:DNA helicase-2/ATP-dependent DNA helicase PcrA
MDALNPAQKEAVSTLAGPLLVLAGAGTGKTRVVTFRVANLIQHGTHPDRILAVTFTNKASLEMQERIAHQLKLPKRPPRGKPAPPRPQIGTFHSHCVQILKRHSARLGYPEKFSIYDRSDSESVARTVLREIRVHENVLAPADFLSIISRWKNAGVRPEQADGEATSDKEHLAAAGFRRYQRALKLQAAFDFDDLLVYADMLLTEEDTVRAEEAGRYDHVLVDEYQDTNGTQYRIIRALASQHRNLCVVGDDDQSIYGWRGAEVRHILNFRNDWPEAKVVRLEENYRSTDAILSMANRLIAFNQHRHDKILRAARPNGQPPRVLQYPSDTEEAKGVVQEIVERLQKDRARTPGDFAILFRTNEQPRIFEMELRQKKVPYTITGTQSFFDRKEVRDLLAFFRWIDQPDDELSLLRIINVPPRGIGAGSIDKLMKHAVDSSQSVWRIMNDPAIAAQLPLPAQRGLASLVALRSKYAQLLVRAEGATAPDNKEIATADDRDDEDADAMAGTLTRVLEQFIREIRYREEIQRLYQENDEANMRVNSVESVVNALAQYEMANPQGGIGDFLNSITLSGREYGSGSDKSTSTNAVSLMTYHSAKGLEFPIVYMVGMEEGVLPHRRSITDGGDGVDEERRLCYVGVTRAQDELSLTLPLSRHKWGKPRPTFPSRFLYELTGQADNPNRLKAIKAAAEEASKSFARR